MIGDVGVVRAPLAAQKAQENFLENAIPTNFGEFTFHALG
jgi:hypothetical protein